MRSGANNRMLSFYEQRSKTWLLRRVPVIVRVDGKSFHTFCKSFEKPYDETLNECLTNTLIFLCKKVQGVVYGQRHSDEMSLLLLDFQHMNSEACFDYNVQKMSSVIAGLCSTEFCRQLLLHDKLSLDKEFPSFDGRAFNMPEFEIANYFWDRSLDCVRNSIQNLARTMFSHKQLYGANNNKMQEMLFSEHGINWSDLPQQQKTGIYCYKTWEEKKIALSACSDNEAVVRRNTWRAAPVPPLKNQLQDIIKSCCKISMERMNIVSNKGEVL